MEVARKWSKSTSERGAKYVSTVHDCLMRAVDGVFNLRRGRAESVFARLVREAGLLLIGVKFPCPDGISQGLLDLISASSSRGFFSKEGAI